jgi:hypothetical protein
LRGTPRRLAVLLALLVAVLCAAGAGGCAPPVSPAGSAAPTGVNPASGRMGALAGIPADSDVPAGGVVPNLAPLVEAGRLAAANSEAVNLKTAARTYLADHAAASRVTSDALNLYLSGSSGARYDLSLPSGLITRVDVVPGGWLNIVFSLSQQKWAKGTPDNDHAADQDVP